MGEILGKIAVADAGTAAGTSPKLTSGMLASLFSGAGGQGMGEQPADQKRGNSKDIADPEAAAAAMRAADAELVGAPVIGPAQTMPVDVQRLIAVLQARRNLGSA